ncbi:late embryogenisis abundant protein 4 [Cinnamomum micranthum f. kanehirae]|uniref:Late embryogenisis abundant protein 4 n=1 Tax=Cinnamomum micranthum f. kanehirae TaxID=337451 RepID=A0A443NWS0_9MAGN|nr:late embryogenisis abundant protein 4 [Cinnamomum micranthum f. kanehirae]
MSGQEEPLRPQEQMKVRNTEEREGEGAASAGSGQLQGLPMESSPYVKYSDLEDYKQQGYGTGGHMEPVETGKGGGSTDAPTLSGGNLTDAQASVVNSLHRKGNA